MNPSVPGGPKTAAHKLIAFDGEIDLHRLPDIKRVLLAATEQRPAKLLLDLSKLTYIDSSGIAAFLETMQAVEAYGGRFYLVALQEPVMTIFETSKLDEVFRIMPSVDAAEAH